MIQAGRDVSADLPLLRGMPAWRDQDISDAAYEPGWLQ